MGECWWEPKVFEGVDLDEDTVGCRERNGDNGNPDYISLASSGPEASWRSSRVLL